MGELLPRFESCLCGQKQEAGEQLPKTHLTLPRSDPGRRQGDKEKKQFSSSPNLLAVLLQFSLLRSFKELWAVDESGMAPDFEIPALGLLPALSAVLRALGVVVPRDEPRRRDALTSRDDADAASGPRRHSYRGRVIRWWVERRVSVWWRSVDMSTSIAPPTRPAGSASASRMPAQVPALVMRRVRKSFMAGVLGCCAEVRVLASASLVLSVGEIVGIAGEAGAGKSTLLLCAAGRGRPEDGRVTWPAASAGPARAEQQPLYLDLRGGLRLREIERALAAQVPILLLDHAAPALLGELRAVISRTHQRPGSAIVIASRSSAELARVASRVLVMHEGRLHAAGSGGSARVVPAQRKRSAARASSELPSALARARMRST